MRLDFLLAALLLSALASPAGASCLPDPGPVTSESCVLTEYMASYDSLNQAILDVTEGLRSLASSNPEFERAETNFMAAEQEWFQRVLKSCDAEDAWRPAGRTEARALQCVTRRTTDRTAAVIRYVADLERIKTLPSTRPPIAPVYDCSVSAAQLALVSAQDTCVIKAIAPRCNEGDACHVRCLADGAAKDIGGGCYHVCARYGLRGTPWEAPPEAAACSRAAYERGR